MNLLMRALRFACAVETQCARGWGGLKLVVVGICMASCSSRSKLQREPVTEFKARNGRVQRKLPALLLFNPIHNKSSAVPPCHPPLPFPLAFHPTPLFLLSPTRFCFSPSSPSHCVIPLPSSFSFQPQSLYHGLQKPQIPLPQTAYPLHCQIHPFNKVNAITFKLLFTVRN